MVVQVTGIAYKRKTKENKHMLRKQYIKSRNVWKVYFKIPQTQLPKGLKAQKINLVGDFNEWNHSDTPMKAGKGDVFQATLELKPGRIYQFRYLINDEHWLNDKSADSYAPSGYGEDNCVLILEDA
jgi:hypothetical protein